MWDDCSSLSRNKSSRNILILECFKMTVSAAYIKGFKLKSDASQADNFEIPWQVAHQLRHCKISVVAPRSSGLFRRRGVPDYRES